MANSNISKPFSSQPVRGGWFFTYSATETDVVGDSDQFPFQNLPPEIRHYVWEFTGSGSRIIEIAEQQNPEFSESELESESESDSDSAYSSHAGDDDREPSEFVYLRPTSRLLTWMEHDFSIRLRSDEPLERCVDSVSLQVSQESRGRALSLFPYMQHSKLESEGFFMNPLMDILFLANDFDWETSLALRTYYGEQLRHVEIIMVEQLGLWADTEEVSGLLSNFQSLKVLIVLLENYEFSEDIDDDEHDPCGQTPSPGKYLKTAQQLLMADSYIADRRWIIEYRDRKGNTYCRLPAT